MAQEQTFEELLSEAPLAASHDTVALVGALERSHEKGKFVLVLGGGRNLTLDVSAVKTHQVLGRAVGQRLVRVEVDRENLPEGVENLQVPVTKNPVVDFGAVPKAPPGDLPPTGTLQEHLGTFAEQLPLGGWGDPYQGVVNPGFAAGVPFALATPHHVQAEVLARLSGVRFPSIPWWTEHIETVPEWDWNRKVATNPSLDISEAGTMVYYDG